MIVYDIFHAEFGANVFDCILPADVIISVRGQNVVDIGPAIGKKKSDKSDISSGRMLPTFDSLNKRCAYFGIPMSEFFDQQVDHPLLAKQMIAEYQRLCGNQTEPFLRILKTMDPSHMDAFLDLAKRISRSGNQSPHTC